MTALSTAAILSLTAGCVGALLLFVAISLHRRGLFHWTSMGFWSWASFALYFVANPLAYLLSDELGRYEVRLALAGGPARGLWILAVIIAGISAFFVSYLRTNSRPVTWNLRADQQQFNPLMLHIMLMVGLFALYSLVIYRANLVDVDVTIENGRFVGQTIGYQSTGYRFWFVPATILLLSNSRLTRVIGWLTVIIFIILALPHGWSRYAIISLALVTSMASALRTARRWPRPVFIIGLLLLAAVLQIRGHSSWSLNEVGEELANNAALISDQNIDVLASSDSAMLASWYLWSYVNDNVTGYDYGLPAINYVLLGWVPTRLLPQKYFIIDWLRSRQPPVSASIETLLYGSKATLLGAFYRSGGVIGVILLAALAGIVSRRIDGMLHRDNPILVQATAISWLSMIWIVWGSGLSWAIVRLGSVTIPVFLLWLLAPKKGDKRRPVSTEAFQSPQLTGLRDESPAR